MTKSARDIFYSYPKLPVDAPMPMYVPLEEYEALKVKAGNMSQDKECDIIQRDERIFELQTENEALMRWLKRWQSIATNIKTIEGRFRLLDELVAATKAVLGE